MDVGHVSQFSLRLAREDAADARRHLVLLHEQATYDLAPSRLGATVELRLNVYQAPLTQLRIELDHPLSLISASLSGTALQWTNVAGKNTAEGRRQKTSEVVLEFPRSLPDASQTLR